MTFHGGGRFAVPFRKFRRILECNNAVIEKIAEMESALGGEYVFDQAFLRSAVAELGKLVREVVYSLNDLSDNRYLRLYERFEAIHNHLQDLVSSGPGPYADRLALPYYLLNRDLDHLVGAKNANLGEIRNYLHLHTPDGFALTGAAYNLFMEENDLYAGIAAELEVSPDNAERAARIAERFKAAVMPAALKETVREQLDLLVENIGPRKQLAVRSSGLGEDGSRSFAGQFLSLLPVKPKLKAVLAAYREVLAARFSVRVLEYLGDEEDVRAVPMAVAVQEYIPVCEAGVIYTLDTTAAKDRELLTITAIRGAGADLVSGRSDGDRYHLSRQHPFTPEYSVICGAPGGDPMAYGESGLRRGSATVDRGFFSQLAEAGLLLEKAFGRPQDIEWGRAGNGQLVILQSRLLHLPQRPPPQPGSVAAELRQAVLLMQGRGHVAQLGIGSGPVVHVEPDSDPAAFPVGAVAVCRYASPQLSGIVRKAAAIITDVGSSTGHLAAIAREYRTPALFGTGNGTEILQEGCDVTVDAEEKRVYAGFIKGLVAMQAAAASDEPYLSTPEVRTLRRMLRWTAPINLTDPTAPNFKAEKCRTLHDIIRFSHEKAVESLIRLHSSEHLAAGASSYALQLALPIQIRLIDLGDGLAAGDLPAGEVAREQVRSRPFNALLTGLLGEGVWDREPAPFGLKDLLANMSRPLSAITNAPAYSGDNLAIIAENYCNLSLRLGYHFNVIDSYLSADPDDNYIYFRFVGGFAEKSKRNRRAALIATILSSLHFKVDQQGDLVIGKVKMLDQEHMTDILVRLGELVGFTRQLDVRMVDEQTSERFFTEFIERARQSQPTLDRG